MAKVLEALMAEYPDPEYRKAYFDNHHPLHNVVVKAVTAKFIEVYGDDGNIHPQRDVVVGEDGEVDWDRTYEAWDEIWATENSVELRKKGIVEAGVVDTSANAASEGVKSIAELKADKEFMSKYGDRYAEGHDEAVQTMHEAYKAAYPDPEVGDDE